MAATKRKITRKELKQPDEFLSFWARTYQWVRHHEKEFLVGLACLLTIAAAAWAVSAHARNRQERASRLLARAQALLGPVTTPGSGEDQKPADRADQALPLLQKLVEDFDGTKASRVGRLLLARIRFNRGQYDAAIDAYREFLRAGGEPSDLRVMAWEGLAYAYEAKGEYEKAAEYYEKLTSEQGVPTRGWAYLGLGRCYERLGRVQQAAEAYEALLREDPGHPEATVAKANLSRLSRGEGKEEGAATGETETGTP